MLITGWNMYIHPLNKYLQNRTDSNPALFVSLRKPNDRLSKSGIEDMIRRTDRQFGIQAFPYRFRGTSLTNAINRGMPLKEASLLAGHSNTGTTMMYCLVDQESVQHRHKKYLSA